MLNLRCLQVAPRTSLTRPVEIVEIPRLTLAAGQPIRPRSRTARPHCQPECPVVAHASDPG
jgi:hypothetical protein